MKILFDQGTPVPLAQFLTGHEVMTAFEMGWSTLENGVLIAAAELQFDVLVTTDKNLSYQQNLTGRHIAILILPTTRWPNLKLQADKIAAAILQLQAGSFVEWQFPADEGTKSL